VEYYKEGHTQKQTCEVFKIGRSTLKGWVILLSETGSLEKRELERKASKFTSEKLRAYIKEHPQAMLKEVAAHFGGSTSGADAALRREKITLKKRLPPTKSETKKNGRNTMPK
jgi:transposase